MMMMRKSKKYFVSIDESDPRDLIDNYLLEIWKGREGFNKDELYGVIFDLFAAGSETTSTTLRYYFQNKSVSKMRIELLVFLTDGRYSS